MEKPLPASHICCDSKEGDEGSSSALSILCRDLQPGMHTMLTSQGIASHPAMNSYLYGGHLLSTISNETHLCENLLGCSIIVGAPPWLQGYELGHVARVQAVARHSAPVRHASQGLATTPVQRRLLDSHVNGQLGASPPQYSVHSPSKHVCILLV